MVSLQWFCFEDVVLWLAFVSMIFFALFMPVEFFNIGDFQKCRLSELSASFTQVQHIYYQAYCNFLACNIDKTLGSSSSKLKFLLLWHS